MNIQWRLTDNYFSLEFDKPVSSISSAILGGGMKTISSFINLRVDENFRGKKNDFPPPWRTIDDAMTAAALKEPRAGMMTAASMNSFKYSTRKLGEIDIYCFLTSGLSNALAAGDPGDFLPQTMYTDAVSSQAGTINIVTGLSCRLTGAALAEALLVVTEAKASVLYELGVKSTASKRGATGTGTDSALIFCAESGASGGEAEAFCGKHTVLGEMIAAAVREALFESLKGDRLFN